MSDVALNVRCALHIWRRAAWMPCWRKALNALLGGRSLAPVSSLQTPIPKTGTDWAFCWPWILILMGGGGLQRAFLGLLNSDSGDTSRSIFCVGKSLMCICGASILTLFLTFVQLYFREVEEEFPPSSIKTQEWQDTSQIPLEVGGKVGLEFIARYRAQSCGIFILLILHNSHCFLLQLSCHLIIPSVFVSVSSSCPPDALPSYPLLLFSSSFPWPPGTSTIQPPPPDAFMQTFWMNDYWKE